MGPVAIGDIWAGFAVEDCTDPSGDPVVLYDQLEDRWLLSQFTTVIRFTTTVWRSHRPVTQPAHTTATPSLLSPIRTARWNILPDDPKYGVWTNSYIMTTRDFGLVTGYGISVYALEKNKMLEGNPNARAVQFFLDFGCGPTRADGGWSFTAGYRRHSPTTRRNQHQSWVPRMTVQDMERLSMP